jgi:hypothetical protein
VFGNFLRHFVNHLRNADFMRVELQRVHQAFGVLPGVMRGLKDARRGGDRVRRGRIRRWRCDGAQVDLDIGLGPAGKAEADPVAGAEFVLGDSLAVDQGAVGRAGVDQEVGAAFEDDLRVVVRNDPVQPIGKAQLGRPVPDRGRN